MPPTRALVIAVAVVVVATSAGTGAARSQTPAHDSATVSGITSTCFPGGGVLQINAQSGPSGENPTGQVVCGTFFGGPVTCLNVRGNVALLTTATGPGFNFVSFRLTDNGASGDRVEAFPTPAGCPNPALQYLTLGDFTGSVVVVDAQPFPTSNDQCKNSGWKSYGVFKNQGDCVSYVATKGKNQPSGH